MTILESTYRKYYENTRLFQHQAQIVEAGQDSEGDYIICDETIFHPQGGGQPSDQGVIKIGDISLTVTRLVAPRDPYATPYHIKHYYAKPEGQSLELTNAKVTLCIDEKFRLMCARLHSAGHLLANAIEETYPHLKVIGGHHFNKQSFILINGSPIPEKETFETTILNTTNAFVSGELPVHNRWDNEQRTIQFGDLKEYPCGGTHVEHSGEIGRISLRSFKKEKGNVKLGYDIVENS